jgi:hypothetical protein
MPLDPAAEALAAARLNAVDAAAPGLVEAFWVTGSAASGDWRPAVSDVDTVAATSREPTSDDLAALAAVHVPGDRPHVDATYVPAAALADPPVRGEPLPHVVDGTFGTGPCGEATPVTWLELRQRGVALRGPAPAELVPAPEEALLRDWLLGNLRGYWSAEADAAEKALAGRPDEQPVSTGGITWLVLGPPRLHATLATGEILSKTEAGEYAARLLPAYADLAERCVAARAGLDVPFTTVDGLVAVALARAVVASAETLGRVS